MNIENVETYLWTDSKIVLDWLSSQPRCWKTFVANRTAEILRVTSRNQWYHVISKDNPADCASRGVNPRTLSNLDLWWHGPPWLAGDKSNWPIQPKINPSLDLLPEKRKNIINIYLTQDVSENEPSSLDVIYSKVSSFWKISKIVAVMWRFIQNCRSEKPNRIKGSLNTADIDAAERLIFKDIQHKYFLNEINALGKNGQLSSSSQLKSLYPFLDSNSILRVGGRLENADLPFDTMHQIILPKDELTIKLIKQQHLLNDHAGQKFLINHLRQKFWVIGGRDLVRRVVRTCVVCIRYRHDSSKQLMGNLPTSRVLFEPPFTKTGVDYAGPIMLKAMKGRCRTTYKAYIAIFVCVTTKAVHIELVTDLTSEGFLAALRRFISRRGVCKDIYSDNGTNFVGARNILNELFSYITENSNSISDSLLRLKINWHLIPPAAPHFGGLWEAAVKSMKHHFKRVVGNTILTYEEAATILAQVEAILNSRPISAIESDDVDALTPGHFLIGRPLNYLPDTSSKMKNIHYQERWKMLQQMIRDMWKRWQKEYLTALQTRNKWYNKQRNFMAGDVVLLREDHVPPSKWIMGRVIQCHPPKDGLVRVVTLETATGSMERAITKLVLLPVVEEDSSRRPGCLRSNRNI